MSLWSGSWAWCTWPRLIRWNIGGGAFTKPDHFAHVITKPDQNGSEPQIRSEPIFCVKHPGVHPGVFTLPIFKKFKRQNLFFKMKKNLGRYAVGTLFGHTVITTCRTQTPKRKMQLRRINQPKNPKGRKRQLCSTNRRNT